jgi:formylglycine-generating enzyme required for sulfatase activity/predicted Ser/Thr protein kinase
MTKRIGRRGAALSCSPTGMTSDADDDPGPSALESPSADSLLREVARVSDVAPSAVPLTPGTTLGRYVVRSRIGEGGMGTVYLAEDTKLGRRVAVKVVRDAMAGSAEGRSRLQREARCAAAISHPGVAQVYDVGEADGRVYIAMELVEGVSLRQLLNEGPLARGRATRIMLDIVNAVAAAHAAGVVHRDLKPENILVGEGDVVKVLDFGLATWLELPSGLSDSVSPTITQLTAGRITGTPGYLAPEQALGYRVTARADIFSLGVIAYEMFCGGRPFRGKTAMDVIVATTRDEAPTPKDEPLGPVIARCLAKAPEDRFASAEELAQALVAPPATRTRKGRAFVVAACLLALAGVIAAGVALRSRPREAQPVVLAGMVHFPRASFVMGTPAEALDAECRALGATCRRELLEREQPPRTVTVGPLYLDVHEVTNEELVAWLNVAPTTRTVEFDPELKDGRWVRDDASRDLVADLWPGVVGFRVREDSRFEALPGCENKPAVQVTWDGARAYCHFRGKRLPTEAEWEYAARGTRDRRYPWGDTPPSCDQVVFGRAQSKPCEGRQPGPESVMTARQDETPEGVFDLAGNVSEWVEDAFVLPYYPPCGACNHPVFLGLDAGAGDLRGFRGSSWSNASHLRTSRRGRWKHAEAPDDMGFRCATDG